MVLGVNARCEMDMRGFFVLGILVVLLGADAASHSQQRGSHIQARSPRTSTKQKRNVEMANLILDPHILSEPSPPSNLCNRSLSPWTYSYTEEKDVFPEIVQAECLKQFCLDSDGKENMDVVSRPIYHQILVLRRVMSKQKKQLNFKLETKNIKVGCTCIRPIVLSQK
ncbi:interleukin-17F-like [Arapaima gigas]